MDYSQLSDFEINAIVHFGSRPEFRIKNGYASFLNGEGERTGVGQFYYKNNFPDYCNSPADAWPIIVENKIWLREMYGIWDSKGFPDEKHPFNQVEWKDENPLRAAMIVFLMMKDSE